MSSSRTALSKKLGIREGDRVWLVGPPQGLVDALSPIPSGVSIETTDGSLLGAPEDVPRSTTSDGEALPEERFDVVLLFSPDAGALRAHFDDAVRRLRWTGGLWVCWPKKASPLYVDLAREEVREVGLTTGLVDNKVCAVDQDWSGLRFVVRKEDRPDSVGKGGPSV